MSEPGFTLPALAFGEKSKIVTNSLTSMQEQVARSMGWNAEYDAVGDKSVFSTQQSSALVRGMRLTTISHTPVRTRVSASGLSFYMPFGGGPIQSNVNGKDVLCEVGKHGLFAPEGDRIGVGQYRSTLMVSLEAERLRHVARSMTGRSDAQLDLDVPAVLSLKVGGIDVDQIIRAACRTLDACGENPGAAEALAIDDVFYRAICVLLIPDSLSAPNDRGRSNGAGNDRQLEEVCQYIQANLTGRITMTDLESISGLSARSLQYAFRRRFDCSPVTWIRNARLDAIRKRLMEASDQESITGVAVAFSFSNPGHFSKYYFERYGEYPSQTLAARRSRRR